MSSALDIGYGALAAGYLLILIPLAIMLYLRVSFLSGHPYRSGAHDPAIVVCGLLSAVRV